MCFRLAGRGWAYGKVWLVSEWSTIVGYALRTGVVMQRRFADDEQQKQKRRKAAASKNGKRWCGAAQHAVLRFVCVLL